eukprot:scaffold114914_cov27-Tisochrysis_lutea.AAC.2
MEVLLNLKRPHERAPRRANPKRSTDPKARSAHCLRVPPQVHTPFDAALASEPDHTVRHDGTATRIPTDSHIKMRSPLPTTHPNRWKCKRDEDAHLWETTLFPSELPVGRDEVMLLRRWLHTAVGAFEAEEAEEARRCEEEAQRYAQGGETARRRSGQLGAAGETDLERRARRAIGLLEIYSTAIHEISRQERTVCAERGALLDDAMSSVSSMMNDVLSSVWRRFCLDLPRSAIGRDALRPPRRHLHVLVRWPARGSRSRISKSK